LYYYNANIFRKMIINKLESIQTLVVENISCDCCGKSCKVGNNDDGQFEYMEMNACWGFESGKDLETWTAHICETCVDEKFTFVNFHKKGFGINTNHK